MLLLLTYRWRMFLNTMHFSSQKQKYSRLAGIGGILFLFWYLFHISSQFFEYVLNTPGFQQPEHLIQNGTAILFNGFFLLLFFNSVTGTARGLFESPEMQLLFSLPIRLRTVLTAKVFDQIFRNAASFGIFGTGVLVAFAFQANRPILFFVGILPAPVFFLINTGLGFTF